MAAPERAPGSAPVPASRPRAVCPRRSIGRHRVLGGARLAWAAALLVAPRNVLGALSPGAIDHAAVGVARVLGARHALQGFLELTGRQRWRVAGSLIDGLHGATAVGLAAVDSRWRRAALVDATLAAAFALAPWRPVCPHVAPGVPGVGRVAAPVGPRRGPPPVRTG